MLVNGPEGVELGTTKARFHVPDANKLKVLVLMILGISVLCVHVFTVSQFPNLL